MMSPTPLIDIDLTLRVSALMSKTEIPDVRFNVR
jgi:hypothetical protein